MACCSRAHGPGQSRARAVAWLGKGSSSQLTTARYPVYWAFFCLSWPLISHHAIRVRARGRL
eukprot:261641-Lingulodinium_polyedra.AAC.1